MSVSEWRLPEFAASDLSYAVTTSVLEQFAQGHTISDVLRELVQNEYDARGSSLSVIFGSEGFEVHGNGSVIDRSGWRRLSVMLGTGRVVGDGRDVPLKVNGIGSKNHGLRSLFLIGDQIYVRSGGRQTVLDLQHGAPREPRPDPSSAHIPGAHIFVPYRDKTEGLLEAYGPEHEARDIGLLADDLAPTLVKLAQPRQGRSLRSVTVSSARLDRTLTWRQKVRPLRRHRLGGSILERTIELREGAASSAGGVATKIVEFEYEKTFEVPSQFRSRVFPSYFRVAGGRVRIGSSLRLKRKRPDLHDLGSFYYPLGFANSSTGSAVSVSAPFEMNSDRTALIDPATSGWNEWLMEIASKFTLDLVVGEWLDSFGGDAFLLVEERQTSAAPRFAGELTTALRERACWPTREKAKGSRRPRLRSAGDIMLGPTPELDSLVPDSRRLDARLGSDRVKEMARRADAKEFTVRSAVRLRCAGQDAADLQTKLGEEARLYYTDFPLRLQDLGLQEQFGRAFEVHRRQLTSSNRSDLRDAPTTLTAAGTLGSPSDLWVVDEALVSAAPVPAAQRLHPELVQYRWISRLCQPLDMSAWARDVAGRADEGTASPEEREALSRYLVRNPEAINRSAWATLRRAPVLRDHRGEWAAPAEMVLRRTAGALRLEEGLRFPGREISRNPKVLRHLRIRSKLAGADLVRYALIVAETPGLAEEFEDTLYQFRSLLTRPTVAKLQSVPFLRSTRGGLVAPEDAYVRTAFLTKCLGADMDFAAGPHTALHARLGCRTQPLADDIVGFLNSLRAAGEGPPHPEVIYPALVEALLAEGDTLRLADEPILYADGEWHAPEDVLVGRKHGEIFLGAAPVVTARGLDRVYEALGAGAEPSLRHWIRFFGRMDELGDGGTRPLSSVERKALRSAYAKLGSLPEGISDQTRGFLDTTGRLHARSDARAHRFVINDEPRTAQAAAYAGLAIAFADASTASTRRFYRSSGISLLTEARLHAGIKVGERRSGPPWFDEAAELERLRKPAFASAVHAVASADGSRTAATERQLRLRLGEISGLVFVRELEDLYRIGSSRLTVPADVAVEGDRLALRFVRSRAELYGLLARAVAGMADTTVALQQPLADSIFRLIMSESSAEIERYLAQRGVVWTATDGAEPEDESLEEGDTRAQIAETLKERLLHRSRTGGRTGGGTESAPAARQQPGAREAQARPLPPLEEVELREAPASDWAPEERQRRGSGGGGGSWIPRSPAEQEEDRALGARGEELVFHAEVERVRALGYPATRVTWTSQSNPAADHDILSVADDGGDLWLEVKSTTGRHGHFSWPRAEFELALRARDRYVLCRVYEAHSTSPTVRREQDPVASLLAHAIRLDIASLAAEVAPLPSDSTPQRSEA